MQKEIWKDVVGYEGHYQVSSLGKVRSKRRELKQAISNGYYLVCLLKDGKTKTFRVHQLVAIAFLNHIPNGIGVVVDHIDHDRLNNNLNNLQLIHHRENISRSPKGTSKYAGVSWNKNAKKWVSQIVINGSKNFLGYFDCELKAHKAYMDKRKEIKQKYD